MAYASSSPGGVIYRIVCKTTGKAYVGQTMQPVAKRFYQHMTGSPGHGVALHGAVRKYGRASFAIDVLESGLPVDRIDDSERSWIAKLGTVAPHGYNLTLGGVALHGHTEESRAKMRAACARRGPISEETRAKLSASHRGRVDSPETTERRRAARSHQSSMSDATREKISLSKRGRSLSVEARKNIAAGQIGRKHTAETKAKIGAAAAGRTAGRPLSAEHRARIGASGKGRFVSDETRARMSAASTGRVVSAETRAKISVARRRMGSA